MYTGFIWKSVHTCTDQEFMFEKCNQRQTLSFEFAGSIHSCGTDKKTRRKNWKHRRHRCVLCCFINSQISAISLSTAAHTHTTEHFHSLAFIHSITGSQRTARENVGKKRDGERGELYYIHQKRTPCQSAAWCSTLTTPAAECYFFTSQTHPLTTNYQKAAL